MTSKRRASTLIGRQLHAAYLVLTLQRPRGLRVSPLFDEAWYRETYDDVPPGRRAAYGQFRRLSLTEGRDPNEHFDTAWYLQRHPDVRELGLHPIDHYLEFGWREGRDPGPSFDGAQYLRYHPEAVELGMDPLQHQLRSGSAGSISGAPGMSGVFGQATNLGVNLDKTVAHYRRFGARRTFERVLTTLSATGPVLDESASSPVVEEVEPRLIKAALETPRKGTVEDSASLEVAGWAYAQGAIDSIELYLDGSPVGVTTREISRPDVAATRGASAGAANSGFHVRLPIDLLDPGTHALQVVIRDDAGHVRVLIRAFESMEPGTLYHRYYRRALPTPEEQALLVVEAGARADRPLFHLVVIDRGEGDLAATLASIGAQVYPSWDCTVLTTDDGLAHVQDVLLQVLASDRATSWSISTDAVHALPLERVPRRFAGFLHAGEVLSPAALLGYASAESDADTIVVYSDHDSVEDTGRHVEPWYVGDWAPDHILSQDYVGGVFLARDSERMRALVARLLASGREGWRYELLLALTDESGGVRHIPQVLWSRPATDAAVDAATAERTRDERAQAEAAAVEVTLERRGTAAVVETTDSHDLHPARRVRWPLPHEPIVSLIIPTTGRRDLVETTLAYLDKQTDYPHVERIFVDNSRGAHPDGIALLHRSGATVIERDQPFNWAALSNDGAREAIGELLLFLNDDMRVEDAGWLSDLVRQAVRPGIGIVGPFMRYPDGRIQHAGIFTVDHGGGAVHLFHGMEPDDGLHLDLHRVTREVSAVTGACLMVERRTFREVGGFNEDLAVVGNDVDFCLRVARTGRRTLWTPAVTLTHAESASRSGVNHLPDEDRMWRRWSDVLLTGDPFYNPNLATDRVDAAVDWRRVASRPDPIAAEERARGINLVGYIRAEMGVGEATRGEAQALTEVGIPFGIIDHRFGNPSRMGDASWQHKVIDEPVFATNILHINADVLPAALEHLPSALRAGRRNIGFWTWELPRFPHRFAGSFDLVDEVWVPSTFVQQAVAADAPVPVRVVPHVVRRPLRPPLGRAYFDLPAQAYQFLVMYDTQSVQARKNPQGAIDAFMRAFEPAPDSATLVLKVNNAGDRELETLRALMVDRPDIHLLTDVLKRHEVDSLIAASDAFVSLHRSEGFGLVIAEAMAQGLPVIATGWSGNTDFMSVETSVLVGYQLVELDHDVGPYEAGQRWAEPDLDDAAAWMRKLHDDPASGVQMGARAAAAIARGNSPAAVGRVIESHLAAATAAARDGRGRSPHASETEHTQGHASSVA